jgi:hypothetical protein
MFKRIICRLIGHKYESRIFYIFTSPYPAGREYVCRRCGNERRELFENMLAACPPLGGGE